MGVCLAAASVVADWWREWTLLVSVSFVAVLVAEGERFRRLPFWVRLLEEMLVQIGGGAVGVDLGESGADLGEAVVVREGADVERWVDLEQ